MSNEYKEWLKEQSFESLANDNLRIKLELKTAKEEIIRLQSNDYFYVELDKKNELLTQQNKQLTEENEKLKKVADIAMKMKVTWDEFDKVNESEINTLTQQNKQLRENINNIKNLCNEDWEDMTVDKFQNQLLQALKVGE